MEKDSEMKMITTTPTNIPDPRSTMQGCTCSPIHSFSTPFFGEALIFKFFSRFKPKNIRVGFLSIFAHRHNANHKNTKT